MNRQTVADLLLADVTRLCWPWTHSEQLPDGRTWTSKHPSLIDQLRAATVPGGQVDDAGPTSVAGPKAPVREEPFMVLHLIGTEAYRLAAVCGAPVRRTTAGTLIGLIGRAGQLNDPTLSEVADTVHGLRTRAETALSWRLRSRRLAAVCPACDTPNRVHVQLDDHGPVDATCAACAAHWPRPMLGILADLMSQHGNGPASPAPANTI